MSRHLSKNDVELIINHVRQSSGKMTWKIVCEACHDLIGFQPTRQTLAKHQEIASALKARKETSEKTKGIITSNISLKSAVERITCLENENQRLKTENANLLKQYAKWQYNAYIHGLGPNSLNKALPHVSRKNNL